DGRTRSFGVLVPELAGLDAWRRTSEGSLELLRFLFYFCHRAAVDLIQDRSDSCGVLFDALQSLERRVHLPIPEHQRAAGEKRTSNDEKENKKFAESKIHVNPPGDEFSVDAEQRQPDANRD